MIKSAIMLAVLVGLCTCAPLLNDTALPLEAALQIPITEIQTNSSIVAEKMPELISAESKKPRIVEDSLTELESLEEHLTDLDDALNELNTEIKREDDKVKKNEESLLDELKEAVKVEEEKIQVEKKESEILETINEQRSNQTERDTEDERIVSEELEMQRLNKTLVDLNEEREDVNREISDREEANEEIVEKLQKLEMKFAQVLNETHNTKSEMETIKNKIVSEEKKEENELVKEIEELKKEKKEEHIHEETEELKKEKKEEHIHEETEDLNGEETEMDDEQQTEVKEQKRSYQTNAPTEVSLPMAELPTTTEAYATAQVVLPMAELPTTTEAYATAQVVLPMAELPTTTEAYATAQVVLPMAELPTTTAPAYKRREVRDILDKITIYFQQKTEATFEYITNSYCKGDKRLQYYKVHPTDATKYVECDPWGKGTIKSCEEGRLWDQFYEMCSTPNFFENSKNLTSELENTVKSVNVHCNNSDFKCVNGGECVQSGETWKCECEDEFNGDFCEYKIVENSIFSAILSEKFDFIEFRDKVSKLAGKQSQLTEEEMENVKHLLNNATHGEIMQYLNLFSEKKVRYDIVMNELIEEILEDIYPDAYYMAVFNASNTRLVEVVRTIPSLISYSKYTNERYDEVFTKYQEVLDKTVLTLNSTWSEVDVEAVEYIHITDHIANQTNLMLNFTMGIKQLDKVTQKETVEKLEKIYKSSKEETIEQILELTSLRLGLIKKMVNQPEIINMRLCELVRDFKEVRELVDIFDKIARESTDVINSLFSYGFWFATNALARKI